MRTTWILLLGLVVATAATPLFAGEPAVISAPNPKLREFLGSSLADPLQSYYGNTVVCLAAASGQELCHVWYNRDGSFVLFDAGMARTGHYTVGSMRADGKVPVCFYADSPKRVNPPELVVPMPAPPPAAGAKPATLVCRTDNFRTVCSRKDADSLTDDEKKLAQGDHFYNGICYPLGPRNVGDVWFEDDDPLPGQLGMDKMMLLPGHQ
jgi:hypothetical protein